MDHISSEERNNKKKYIAFFDLDRTLIGEVSGNVLIRRAWKKGLMKWTDISSALYLYILYKISLRDPLTVINDLTGMVKGRSEADIKMLCSEVCRDVLLPSVLRNAVEEIIIHKENNAKVVILSSSLNHICREVTEKLGMDDYICSSLEAKDGYLTGRSLGQLCFGYEKHVRLTGYCKINTMNPSDSWYYGDSITDLPALISVGNPVCVNPDRKLVKEAQKRGWKILFWHY